jgi:integrase
MKLEKRLKSAHERLRPLLLVLFHTMGRFDEVLRLKWEDVNFQEKAVRLWTRKRRGVIGSLIGFP